VAHRFLFSAVLLSLLSGSLSADFVCGAEYEARIWADKSGKFEIRATYVDVIKGKVRLERPNGTISRVPLEKLSEADQKYIRDLDKNPQPKKPEKPVVLGLQVGDKVEAEDFGKWRLAKVVEIDYEWDDVDVRFEGESNNSRSISIDNLRYPGTTRQPILVKPAASESNLKTVRPDYDDMDRLLADGSPADRVEPDPQPPLKGTWKPRAVRLASAGDLWDRVGSSYAPTDFAITTLPTPQAIVVYGSFVGQEDDPASIELVDLARRKILLKEPAPVGTGKIMISPGGGSIATLHSDRGGSDSDGLIHFWDIAEKKISHRIGFAPYVMNAWPDLDPEWSVWLDDKRFFTLNREGQLILWQVDGAKAIYELLVDSGAQPILTLGNKYLVMPSSTGIQFFDPASGELKALVGSDDYRHAKLTFSPSGKQLAVVSRGFIDVLDVTTGETTRSFPCEKLRGSQGIAWIDEEYLFAENGLIIHVPLRLIAWEYELHSRLIKSFAGTHWALMEDMASQGQILTPLVLPPPEAVDAIKNLDQEDLLVVRPGDAISIEVQIQGNNFLAEDVKRALVEALADAEMKVGDDTELTLVARATTGETEKVRYTRFGAFNDKGETISVTSRVYELELQRNGAIVWQRKSHHSAPHHVRMEKGESIRAAVDRVMKPTARNFRGRLPSYVLRPEYREPLGKSKLSL